MRECPGDQCLICNAMRDEQSGKELSLIAILFQVITINRIGHSVWWALCPTHTGYVSIFGKEVVGRMKAEEEEEVS